MSAAENLARWRQAADRHAEDRAVFYDDPDSIGGPFIAHRSEFCDVRHSKRETCNTNLREAMPALLAFAEEMLAWVDHMERSAESLYASSEGDDASVNHAENLRGDARYIRRLAEQHLGGAR